MNTPPAIPALRKCDGKSTSPAVAKGVGVGVAITFSMLFCSWSGLVGFDRDPDPFELLMLLLNLPPILFVMGGAKGRTGDYYILGFLIVVWWVFIGSLVGFLIASLSMLPRKRKSQ